MTKPSFALDVERVRLVVRKLREVARGKSSNSLHAAHFVSTDAFVSSMIELCSDGSLGQAWGALDKYHFTKIAKTMDHSSSGKVYWREFIQTLICALVPKNCLPTPMQLCRMYTDFTVKDNASPTLSSADAVEWTEYSQVTLWFEKVGEEKFDLDLGQQLRDLYWYIWVGGSGNGFLGYRLFLFHLCLDPRRGPGNLRAVGLHKAWILMCEIKGKKDLRLNCQSIIELMSMECYNPRFIKVSRLFTSEDIQDLGFEITYNEFVSRADSMGWFDDADAFPYFLKDIFRDL